MPIIIPANSASSGGFEVANSCMFNSADSASFSKTPGGAGSNTVWTVSMWVKRGSLDAGKIHAAGTSSTYEFLFDDSNFGLTLYNGSTTVFVTTRALRDTSAWYHIVLAYNTGNSGTDKVKLYINGVQETAFSTDNRSSAGAMNHINQAVVQYVGRTHAGGYFDGYMAEVCIIDGTSYAASDFGEFGEDSGIWKPKDVSGLTFGTNGFYLDFEDSANLGNDANGGTDLTENNIAATDQTTDTCTNNFTTLNPLVAWRGATVSASTLVSNGNTQFDTGTNAVKAVISSSIGVSSGKWYCELKTLETDRMWIGIINKQFYTSNTNNFWTTNIESGFFWYGNGSAIYNDNDDSYSSYGGYTDNDIVMMALDMDNYAWYLGKNGTWLNSGNPESGSSKTGSVTNETNFGTNPLTNHGEVFFMQGDSSTAGTSNAQWNFGNPFFSISSGNSDGNGYGNFEYTVPNGYFSLNSKNLAEYGG